MSEINKVTVALLERGLSKVQEVCMEAHALNRSEKLDRKLARIELIAGELLSNVRAMKKEREDADA